MRGGRYSYSWFEDQHMIIQKVILYSDFTCQLVTSTLLIAPCRSYVFPINQHVHWTDLHQGDYTITHTDTAPAGRGTVGRLQRQLNQSHNSSDQGWQPAACGGSTGQFVNRPALQEKVNHGQ